jgi:hypothetical protein
MVSSSPRSGLNVLRSSGTVPDRLGLEQTDARPHSSGFTSSARVGSSKPVAATQSQPHVTLRRLLDSQRRSRVNFRRDMASPASNQRAAQYLGELLGDLMPQESEKNDDRNGDPQQVKQNSTAHDFLLCFGLAYPSVRLALKSRTFPPCVAARLAAKAPKSSAAVSHRDNLAAAFRALSKSVFACSMTFETRLSASA